MTNAEAMEATVAALEPYITPHHGALVRAATVLAEELDDPKNRANAAMWKQYRDSIAALLAIVPEAKPEHAQATLLELVRPALGNAKKSTEKKPGASTRGNRRSAGPAADAVAAAGSQRRSGASA